MPFFIKKKKKVNRHAQFHEDLKTDFLKSSSLFKLAVHQELLAVSL